MYSSSLSDVKMLLNQCKNPNYVDLLGKQRLQMIYYNLNSDIYI